MGYNSGLTYLYIELGDRLLSAQAGLMSVNMQIYLGDRDAHMSNDIGP